MKNKASGILKQIISVVRSLVKAKSLAVKSKTNAVKARLIIFGLLRSKKALAILPTLSQKVHALLAAAHSKREGIQLEAVDDDQGLNKAVIVYNAMASEAPQSHCCSTELALVVQDRGGGDDDDDKYPDLTHSLFDELEFDDGTESVIELVKNSREDAANFRLEDEIDHVADVFIRRFHQRMQIQKQASLKRYKEMMDRSV